MRSILFSIPVDATIPLGPVTIPLFGFGLLLAIWVGMGLYLGLRIVRRYGASAIPMSTYVVWGVIAVVIFDLPRHLQAIPIFGYGAMLFLGFFTATSLASRRLKTLGADGEIAWDAALWIFLSGIAGARLFFVIQYYDRVFHPQMTPVQWVQKLVNLPDGGLVFYGGAIGAALAYPIFCWRRRLNPLALGDVLITSVFIGMAFGRLGCLLNGCCYGDFCEYPWAIRFPAESVPWRAELQSGFITADAPYSLPLHPTQLYSAISGGVLALATWAMYPFRNRNGQVMAFGWISYPICRFLVEFLRDDELGQFGTSFTISQWVSAILVGLGVAFLVWIESRPRSRSLAVHIPAPVPQAA